ncbi:MAG TPA: hypothetical protein PLO37_01090 [Candidatus Hydrogenedentes bacterium]|nr:hypothetical protein [Candidatus Hydrogenedentota bacterium]HPG65410.1 hypothetical protein [Candidatus Hydrogenedentota bacterium]
MKKVYISFLLHGNMCYDRYTKQVIRDKFPRIYAAGVRAMHRYPQVTAHIDFPGLTTLSIQQYAPWLLDELRPLVERKQVVMVGCQYAANHALCADEESDLLAARLGMEILRNALQPDISTFFPQEFAFHPQSPYIMNQIGARRLIIQPGKWKRPKRVRGIDGSEVNVYSLENIDQLETFYDDHEDGDFVLTGGDFEMLGNIDHFVETLERLAARGKAIEWTTVDRYERDIGITEVIEALDPTGNADEDRMPSPSFSRWVGDPEDMIWHGHAVAALEALRAAGFAKVAARVHGLDAVDVPIGIAWTTPPDNAWDGLFEEVLEYPETEEQHLAFDGAPSILSRAWHHALIGINSDASGWFPWQPRTRHRNTSLRAANAYAREVIERFAAEVANHVGASERAANGYVLALNPAPAREAAIELITEGPTRIVDADGKAVPNALMFENGRWHARAHVALPAYGYAVLALASGSDVEVARWEAGCEAHFEAGCVRLHDDTLEVEIRGRRISVSVAPFRLSDPSGAAPAEDVAPTWQNASTRVRRTRFGVEFEVFTELAWAVWLRLVFELNSDHITVNAEVDIDMPRRIGHQRYRPEGLEIAFRGCPGKVFYDVPYATIAHRNDAPSYIAAQRFAALDAGDQSFALIALAGNQSFRVSARDGILAAHLGASTQGRPDTRPECEIRPDGTGAHHITSGGDPFMGHYTHRFALVLDTPDQAALAARRLRTPVPLVRFTPSGGDWPAARSLLDIEPATAHVTAFRAGRSGCEVVVNNAMGQGGVVRCQGHEIALGPYGVGAIGVQ